MATNTLLISTAFPTLSSFSKPNPHLQCHVSSCCCSSATIQLQRRSSSWMRRSRMATITNASGDDETVEVEEAPSTIAVPAEQVSVPVSPSDVLTMFFQAEGTMNEMAISTVTSALQETAGISNLKVRIVEGIASVELMKQTTIQATGVASNLVEIIQGSGFKLQTLNLSFEDEEESLVSTN